VQEIARELGFDHAFGTRVVVDDFQPLIAEINGCNNKRQAKLPPMEAAGLLPCDAADSWAYSDSAADLPMLELAKNRVLINPNRSFTAQGEAGGWRILRPPRPWRSKPGQLGAILRQVLGIYR
jgi:phosphoserine phosphatase